MGANEIRKNDVGTVFTGTIRDSDNNIVDLVTAITKQIILLRPDGTNLTADASFYTDGTDGVLTYTTQSGDLNMCGKWRIQWYVTLDTGNWKTDIKTFKVYDNLT